MKEIKCYVRIIFSQGQDILTFSEPDKTYLEAGPLDLNRFQNGGWGVKVAKHFSIDLMTLGLSETCRFYLNLVITINETPAPFYAAYGRRGQRKTKGNYVFLYRWSLQQQIQDSDYKWKMLASQIYRFSIILFPSIPFIGTFLIGLLWCWASTVTVKLR